MALAPVTIQCMPARLRRAPTACLHPASTTPDDTQSPPRAELRIAHPVGVAGQVVDALARLLASLTVGVQFGQDRLDPPRVQLVPAVLAPAGGQVRAGAVDGLGDIAQMPLGVVEVDDFDGGGELFAGQIPESTRRRRR